MTAARIALLAAVCPFVLAPVRSSSAAKGHPERRKPVAATRPGKIQIAGRDAAEILKRLGARREDGATDEQLGSYVGAFNTCDRDGDGKHTEKEYIEDGHYLTPRARRGVFRASDNNADGRVTTVEYVLNRIITEEAKRIVQAMDSDKNGTVHKAEFLRGSPIRDRRLGEQVFQALDTNGDGTLLIPEYLRVWGRWARPNVKRQEAKVAARLAKLRPGRPGRPPSVDRIFKIMDRNKDGKLTKEEFRGPKHVFAAADVNEDGFLTRAELTELRQRRPTTRPSRRDKDAARSQPVRRPCQLRNSPAMDVDGPALGGLCYASDPLAPAGKPGREKGTAGMMTRSRISVACVALAAVTVALGGCQAADPALKGCWSFDEGSGTVAKNAADGAAAANVPAALKWVDGKKGKAIAFNGKDFVIVKHCPAFNAPQYTIAAWTKLADTGEYHYIAWKAGPAFPEEKNARRYDLWVDLDGTVQGIMHDEAGTDTLQVSGQTKVADGKWHHVALTYDGKAITLYIDGKKENEQTPTGPLAKNEHDLWIGGRPEGVVATGVIDEVRFYTRALPPAEIAALAAAK